MKKFDFNKPVFSPLTENFSQLIWKSTTSVGCARCGGIDKNTNMFLTYVVCNFSPKGNIEGQFEQNVMKII